MKARLKSPEYLHGISSGNKVILAQAITLIESKLKDDQEVANEILENLLPETGRSIRIGITGVPGVGKSTFIEALGKHIIHQEKKVAVLTIDPTSQLTQGSILGDKTRMEELSKNPMAFIRPTAAGQALGGVGNKTREAILLCEAAGYEVIIIETVGVGQSEISVKNMVDFFLLLMLAGAGDELQGIKKGITEMADAIVITKADGDNLMHAKEAQAEIQHALHLLSAAQTGWTPKVLTASAITGEGVGSTWQMINEYCTAMIASGFLNKQRKQQNITWLNDSFNDLLSRELQRWDTFKNKKKELEEAVTNQKITTSKAAEQLLESFYQCVRETNSSFENTDE